VLPDPADVGLQRLGKLIGTRLELGRIIEEYEIQPPQRLGRRAVCCASAHDRRETLVQRSGVLNFLQCFMGSNGIRRQHEHNRVSAGNQRFQALPPILEGINLCAVDQRLETALLERRFEAVGEGHVPARIGDKDSGLRITFPRVFGIGDHWPSPLPEILAGSEPAWNDVALMSLWVDSVEKVGGCAG
jgi:hypothetical protein